MTMRFRSLVMLTVSMASVLASGQTNDDKSSPVEVKRVPAPTRTQREPLPNPGKYPFGRLIQTLGSEPSSVLPSPAPSAASPPTAGPGLGVPADFRPSKDVA